MCWASGSRGASTGSSATGSRRRRSASSTIAALEDQELLGHLSEAGGNLEFNPFTPGRAVSGLVALVNRYVPVVVATILIGVVFSWLAALAILTGSMLIRYGTRRGLVVENGMWRANFVNLREAWYFRGLALEPPAGKELRIYGLVPVGAGPPPRRLRALVGDALADTAPALHDADGVVRRGRRVLVCAAALVALGHAAAHGDVSLRDTAFVLQAGVIVARVGLFFMEADLGTEFGMSAYQALGSFEEKAATRYAPTGSGSRSAEGLPARVDPLRERVVRVPGRGAAGARRARPRDPGRRLARDRRPERRRQDDADQAARAALRADVRPDHASTAIDVRELELAGWRSRIAAIFQDFVHYELPVADNIGFGAVAHARRRGRRSGAPRSGPARSTLIEALPAGLATPLSARYTGGVDVSGGQWQRIALAARAVRARAGHVGARARRADREPRRPRRGRALRPLHRDHRRRDDDPDLAPLLDRAPRRPDRRARRTARSSRRGRTTSSSRTAAATRSSSAFRPRGSPSTRDGDGGDE